MPENKQKSAQLLAAEAALQLLKEHADYIEFVEQFEMSFNVPIKGTGGKAKVVMTVKVEA